MLRDLRSYQCDTKIVLKEQRQSWTCRVEVIDSIHPENYCRSRLVVLKEQSWTGKIEDTDTRDQENCCLKHTDNSERTEMIMD